jgi:hypothetical protein
VLYVVNWQAGDGAANWHAAADLTDAAARVEHLRNSEGIDGARIYQLEEVAFELRPYFKVELAGTPATPPEPVAGSAQATPVAAADAEAADDAADEREWAAVAPVGTPEDEDMLEGAADGANGTHRRGLFGR